MEALLTGERKRYHKSLLEKGILTINGSGVPSNADKSSKLSISIAKGIADTLMAETAVGQTSGAGFEQVNLEFLANTFPKLQGIRPGGWHIVKLGNRNALKTSGFAQYEHLEYLSRLTAMDARLAASMRNDYMVAPDLVVYREPLGDSEINQTQVIVDDDSAKLTYLRKKNGGLPILHASVSAKWTMRSDRAQNSRTEALGLIRNRKGNLPHIVVVTGEPLPSRLASLALGTGDIDCMYHFALYELIDAENAAGAEDSIEMLDVLIQGKRLKDISDLPLDLAV